MKIVLFLIFDIKKLQTKKKLQTLVSAGVDWWEFDDGVSQNSSLHELNLWCLQEPN